MKRVALLALAPAVALAATPPVGDSKRLHKCLDPATGASEYTVEPRPEQVCTVLPKPEPLPFLKQKFRPLAERVATAKRLNARWPGVCTFAEGGAPLCEPRRGMRVAGLEDVLVVARFGVIDDARGLRERWVGGGCEAIVRAGVIESVVC